MGKKAWVGLAISLTALTVAGIRYSSQSGNHQDQILISRYVEGFETPLPTATGKPTSPPKAAVVLSEKPLSAEDRAKLVIFREIIETKNDNDPRIDTELDHLSPELKRALTREYLGLRPEKLNHRGTIVFLVGRSLSNAEDVDFLTYVLMEKPCLSLGDCSREVTEENPEIRHHDVLNQTTLNYPQLMAIRQATEEYSRLKGDPGTSSELLQSIVQMLNKATLSPNPRVVQEAQKALKGINP